MYNIYKKIYFCRQFELMVAKLIQDKQIYIPTYLSIGQEHVPAIISELFPNSYIFPQHRCHSWYLCYGGQPAGLLKELLGIVDHESSGMRGSASVNIANKMFGHSGLLGDQIPIAVGFADSKKEHTVCVAGDAAMEEDYALGALGYAATHNSPIWFVVEDNNLSILTEKYIRRRWNIIDIARSFGIESYNISDLKVSNLYGNITNIKQELGSNRPVLLNINVERHYWHAGAGQDKLPSVDFLDEISDQTIKDEIDIEIGKLWELSQKLLKK